MAPDLIIRNAVVIDGTGAARFDGDVAVTGDRITGVGEIDADGSGAIEILSLIHI